jgi:hypothetical protein
VYHDRYWAIARAYSPAVLKPYVQQLSESVVLAFLFDREVNCRRAASAAFQEFVGRQGTQNFKHGISILTTADYFSLGNRTDAYTKIAYNVSQFNEYRRPILDNLFRIKSKHWDKVVRTLAAEALGKLTHLDTEYVESAAIPLLLENSLDARNVQLRHGAVLGLAEITLGYNSLKATNNNSLVGLLKKETLASISELVATIEKKRLYRGKGGEQMREAVCRLIECISITEIPLSVPQQVSLGVLGFFCLCNILITIALISFLSQVRLLDSIDACLPHPSEAIQEQAGKALRALMKSYFTVGAKGPSDRLQKRVLDKYVEQLRTSINPAYTRGFSMALGHLPAKLLAPSIKVLDLSLVNLCRTSRPDAKVGNDKDAETRRNSLISLARICKTVGIEAIATENECIVPLTESQVGGVFTALFLGLEDYNMERRGDVGSMSRIVAIQGLEEMALVTTRNPSTMGPFFSEETSSKIVGGLLKQLSEKLDAVRSEAGKTLVRILKKSDPPIPFILKKEELLAALNPEESINIGYDEISWADASVTFPMVMKAASIDEYFDDIISGLVISVGCLTQSVSKHASAVLLQWVKGAQEESIQRLGESKIFCLHVNVERILNFLSSHTI